MKCAQRFLLHFWLQYIFTFAKAYIDIFIYHLLVASSCPTRSLRMHRHWQVVEILQRKNVLDWRLLWLLALIHAEGLRNMVIVTKRLPFFLWPVPQDERGGLKSFSIWEFKVWLKWPYIRVQQGSKLTRVGHFARTMHQTRWFPMGYQ